MVSMDIGGSGGLVDDAVGIGVGIASVVTGGVPAMLRCLDPMALGLVLFDFNPSDITIARSNNASSRPNSANRGSSMGGGTKLLLSKAAPPSITLKTTFTGETTKMRCDTLQMWCAPPSGLLAMAANLLLKIPPNPNPPMVTFQWGPPIFGFMYTVNLTSVTAKYIRFHSSGIPIRAEVDLKMQVQPSLLSQLPTNPTSGGQPGRSTHMLREGESLQSIAQTYYKRPGLWRKIAEVNGITDPSRVRPGTTVFLPNGNEITTANPS